MMRNNRRPMLKSAGIETASENSRVLMPLADLTRRRMRPIRNTRSTRSRVGDTNIFSIISFIARPATSQKVSNKYRTAGVDKQVRSTSLYHSRQWWWWRSMVVKTSVLACGLFLSCARLMDGCLTTLWVRRPLSVNRYLQLPSLRGRLNE